MSVSPTTPVSIPSSSSSSSSTSSSSSSSNTNSSPSINRNPPQASPLAASPTSKSQPQPQFIDLPLLQTLLDEAKASNNFTPLIRKIGYVFSDPECMKLSFLRSTAPLEGEGEIKTGKVFYSLDIASVRAAYQLIVDLDNVGVNNVLISANGRLAAQLKHASHTTSKPEDLRPYIILFENPQLVDPETHKEILGPLLSSTATLPSTQLAILKEWFSGYDSDSFRKLVGLVQQFITLHILTQNPISLNRETSLVNATKVLELLHPINERFRHVPYTEFYNEMINENIELKEDYVNWKQEEGFSFCHYPFILDPGVKSKVLQIESYMQMQQQRRNAFNLMLLTGQGTAPYLVFRVRRNYLIRDTITQISLHPEDLRKELKVQFVGEEGIDQGGVQKEFFQLIVRSIFDPAYGMFVQTKENLYWFNSNSTELDDFKLIGTISLIIFNKIIFYHSLFCYYIVFILFILFYLFF